jgi:hypothetical protein
VTRFLPSVIAMGILASAALPARADDPKTYRLTIDDAGIDIDPGETLEIVTPDGRPHKVTLSLNEFATFAGDMFSFVHPTNVAVTETKLDVDIVQYLMTSALGTLIIIQEYGSMNPASLDKLMLQELTKESVQAGAERSEEPGSRTLADGKQLTGLKARVKTRSDTTSFEILGYGTADKGVLVVTRIDESTDAKEGSMIEKFWQSLRLKL